MELRHMELEDLPSVETLSRDLIAAEPGVPGLLLRSAAQDAIATARTELIAGGTVDPVGDARKRAAALARSRPSRVVNATGVLLHTNMGRAVVSNETAAAGAAVATNYGNVEFDLGKGERGGRGSYLGSLLTSLTGAEAALVVNNNAGALVLALAAIAGSGNVVVSRGELIEIGGSFRLPTLMETSGARLVEVGTTNRTRPSDYESVLDEAAMILKVHPSNYRIEGFTDEVTWADLGALATTHGVPYVADVGSGLLDTRTPWLEGSPPEWTKGEPGVRQTLAGGADVVLFSGDKLLGGPQAGIAVGATDHIEAMARHPLARALRFDGPSEASLVTTLEHYAAGKGTAIPFWRMATLTYSELEERHHEVLAASGLAGKVIESMSLPGAGSVPGIGIRSPAIQIDGDADGRWRSLLEHHTPIVARRKEGVLLLDLRTVESADDGLVATALSDIG